MAESEQSAAPLTVATLTGAEGKTTTAVLGNTYDAKLILAAHGGKYDNVRKFWTFDSSDEATAAVALGNRLYAMRAARRGGTA
jgi:hypothetical protein